MKKICSFLCLFSILTFNSYSTTNDEIIAQIKKDFSKIKSENNFNMKSNGIEKIQANSFSSIQENNLQKIIFNNYNNGETSIKEYFLKDNVIKFISTKNIKDKTEENREYYFDNEQKLIRYIDENKKNYDNNDIPSYAKEKAENLKQLTIERAKIVAPISTNEIKKEVEELNKEIIQKFDEIEKEFNSFLKNF
nr:hypothetical protein [Fusobacterium gastrosuis]